MPPETLTDDLARTVLAAFGLTGTRVLGAMEASTRNDNLFVEDATGRRFVLRRCRRNADPARIRWQCRLQRRLLAAGFPVPGLIAAQDGEDVVEVGGCAWILQAYVEGQHYDFERIEQAEEAGRWLAEFHLATAGLDADGASHVLEIDAHRYLEIDAHRYWVDRDAELARLRARFAGDGVVAGIDEFGAWLHGMQADWPNERFDALPAGWVHGDYHGRNLLFEGDRVVALLDFDIVEVAPFVLDLTRAVIAFGRERRGSRVIRVGVARRLLAAYETVRPLLPDEREAIAELAPIWEAPLDNFYEWHPLDRRQPLTAIRAHLDSWRSVVERRAVLEEVVRRP